MTDKTVFREWAKRPNDQRYLSLDELQESVTKRYDYSKTDNVNMNELRVYGTEENELVVNSKVGPKFFTNWSFSQFAGQVGAPAGYLKSLNSQLAAANLNYGLKNNSKRDISQILINGEDKLRAITSITYGRIWDADVVKTVRKVIEGSNWQIPSSSYTSTDPLRATTLYASDRDVFIFLVDPDNPITLPGSDKPIFRGFYVWNSEVGAQVFGLATFLYQYVCDNRMIWGMQNKNELRIRHSAGAPDRFLKEGKSALLEYANEATQPIIDKIKRAQNIKLGKDEDEVRTFLRKNGFNLATANLAIDQTKMDGKDITNAWAITEGITASARAITHTDTRIGVEKLAGKILTDVTA